MTKEKAVKGGVQDTLQLTMALILVGWDRIGGLLNLSPRSARRYARLWDLPVQRLPNQKPFVYLPNLYEWARAGSDSGWKELREKQKED